MVFGDEQWRRLYDKAQPAHRLEMLRYAASCEIRGEATKLYIQALENGVSKLQSDVGWMKDRTEWGR